MWCLIVSIPEVCPLSYFEKSYALLYPYIKSFSMSDPWPKDLMNRAPERRIDLASGTCNKIMPSLSFKIMKGIFRFTVYEISQIHYFKPLCKWQLILDGMQTAKAQGIYKKFHTNIKTFRTQQT